MAQSSFDSNDSATRRQCFSLRGPSVEFCVLCEPCCKRLQATVRAPHGTKFNGEVWRCPWGQFSGTGKSQCAAYFKRNACRRAGTDRKADSGAGAGLPNQPAAFPRLFQFSDGSDLGPNSLIQLGVATKLGSTVDQGLRLSVNQTKIGPLSNVPDQFQCPSC